MSLHIQVPLFFLGFNKLSKTSIFIEYKHCNIQPANT